MKKKTHETESTDSKVNVDDHEIYSPIEDLQRIEGVGPLKRNSLDLDKQPKAIKFIGYFFIAFVLISTLFFLIANFL
ncbi:hypothetical protein [Gottfriedia solisilvae]|uniref:Amino acid transporter n=1 Tax=Gottfriedia solisilvae TaxID=1516104 RepID=A0A8J3ACZ9_9BACI|nr:hypothetical protein [Gottfriedia solisilvae]GGI11731.1 hypothetical protein GCM10007380_09310 [Gottfriedia solisilvae]